MIYHRRSCRTFSGLLKFVGLVTVTDVLLYGAYLSLSGPEHRGGPGYVKPRSQGHGGGRGGVWEDAERLESLRPIEKEKVLYFMDVQEKCLAVTEGHEDRAGDSPLCPCLPDSLVNNLRKPRRVADWEELESTLSDRAPGVGRGSGNMALGGVWDPPDCYPRARVAILIPYRDRQELLLSQLAHLIPILQKQYTAFRIFVIEQSLPLVFNKGALINAGFREAVMTSSFDCVIIHDVDTFLEDDRNVMACHRDVIHLSSVSSRYNYREPTNDDMSGVLSMPTETFSQIHGYSNRFFGANGLNTDLFNRISSHNLTVRRPPMSLSYAIYAGAKDGRRKLPPLPEASVPDDLMSLHYTADVQVRKLVTWISIKIIGPSWLLLSYPPVFTEQYSVMHGECYSGREEIDTTDELHDLSPGGCEYLCTGKAYTECTGFVYTQGAGCALINRAPCADEETPHLTPGVTTYTRSMGENFGDLKNGYLHTDISCNGAVISEHQASARDCAGLCDVNANCTAVEYDRGSVAPYLTRCKLKAVCQDSVNRRSGKDVRKSVKTYSKVPALADEKSGVRFIKEMGDCNDNHYAAYNNTLDQCSVECKQDVNCAAFVFTKLTNRHINNSCFLQNKCTRVIQRFGIYVYIKRND